MNDTNKLPPKLLVLLLLKENGGTIEGITRLQKFIFLVQNEWDEEKYGEYPFEELEFEPYVY